MMRPKKKNNKYATIIGVDKKLDNYRNQQIFKEKLDKANEILSIAGLPKSQK